MKRLELTAFLACLVICGCNPGNTSTADGLAQRLKRAIDNEDQEAILNLYYMPATMEGTKQQHLEMIDFFLSAKFDGLKRIYATKIDAAEAERRSTRISGGISYSLEPYPSHKLKFEYYSRVRGTRPSGIIVGINNGRYYISTFQPDN